MAAKNDAIPRDVREGIVAIRRKMNDMLVAIDTNNLPVAFKEWHDAMFIVEEALETGDEEDPGIHFF